MPFVPIATTTRKNKPLSLESKIETARQVSGDAEDIAIVVGTEDRPPSVETLPEEFQEGTDFYNIVKAMQPGDFVIVKLLR